MNRKHILTLLLITIATIAGYAQKVIINGNIINHHFQTVELISAFNKDLPVIAQADIQNNKFKLQANINTTDLFFLRFSERDNFLICLSPNEQISISLDGANLRRVIAVSGSNSMQFVKDISDIVTSKQSCLDSINSLLQKDYNQIAFSGFNSQFTQFQQANAEWDNDMSVAFERNDSIAQLLKQYAPNGHLDKKHAGEFLSAAIKQLKIFKNYYTTYQNYSNNTASSIPISKQPIANEPDFNRLVDDYLELLSKHSQLTKSIMQDYVIRIDTMTNEYDGLFYDGKLERSKEQIAFGTRVLELIKLYTPIIADNKLDFNNQSADLKKNSAQIIQIGQDKVKAIIAGYQKIYDDENKRQNDATRRLMIQNKNNLAALMFLDNFSRDKVLQSEVLTALHKTFPSHEAVTERYNSINTPQYRTAEGSIAPELEFAGVDGVNRKLSDLRGKYVLVDFWASWCGPCRKENPHVVSMYAKYHDKGFEVFSVSLDKTKQSWTDAIAKDKLTWPNHVSDLKGWGSEAAKIYGVNSIPSTFLLDKEGRIIAKNLRGQALTNVLQQIFGE